MSGHKQEAPKQQKTNSKPQESKTESTLKNQDPPAIQTDCLKAAWLIDLPGGPTRLPGGPTATRSGLRDVVNMQVLAQKGAPAGGSHGGFSLGCFFWSGVVLVLEPSRLVLCFFLEKHIDYTKMGLES